MSRVNKIMVIQCKKRETVKFKLIKFYSIHIATVRILVPFFLGGGSKSILFSLFWNNKASSKYIYTLDGVHIWVFFNTESLNERAPHFNCSITYNDLLDASF